MEAAWADPFGGYAIDGDDHWTVAGVPDRWRDRGRLREWISVRPDASVAGRFDRVARRRARGTRCPSCDFP